MTSRTRLSVDARRAQLLALGERLFTEQSYDEVAIDDIAREAGVSKGLLYHYFGGKRDFYVAVVREAAQRLDEAATPDPSLPPIARAIAGLQGYLGFVEGRAAAFSALMRGGLGGDAELSAIIESTRSTIMDRFLRELGLNEPRPVYRTAIRSWIGAVEAASLDWLDTRDLDRDTLVTLLLGSLGGHLLVARRLDPEAGVSVVELEDLIELLGQLG